jgi:hypothetical protein
MAWQSIGSLRACFINRLIEAALVMRRNSAGITWGGFMGGFNLEIKNANSTTGCARSTYSAVMKRAITDYIPHHNWFQYYALTANPTHARPSLADVGYSFAHDGTRDPANHEYDFQDFYDAVGAGNFPAVSSLSCLPIRMVMLAAIDGNFAVPAGPGPGAHWPQFPPGVPNDPNAKLPASLKSQLQFTANWATAGDLTKADVVVQITGLPANAWVRGRARPQPMAADAWSR